MVLKIKEHIILSKSVKKCKGCCTMIMCKYLDNTRCHKCDEKYNSIIKKILNT